MNTEELKRCPDCKQIKPRTEFYRNKARKDGQDALCKPCRKIRGQQFRAKNPTYHAEWYQKVRKPKRQAEAARRKAEKKAQNAIWGVK